MNKNKRKQMKPRYVLWLIIVLCLVFIGVSLKNNGEKLNIQNGISSLVLPMEKGLNSIGQWIGERREYSRSVNDLLTENEELKQQIDQLNTKISSMENNLSELESLRELLKMKEVYPDYDMVGARIISKDAGNWYNSFIIDKGSNDGIKKDMNVIYDNGLVGIVSDVSANNATVRAIIDDTSSVSGMLSKSTELCIVNGDLKLYQDGLLDVEMISKDAQIAAGDEVVTSYISDKYLPGLVIGYISDVSMDSSNLSQNAHITPKVSFDNITNVMVITQLKADLVASESEEEES
ncbi:rod shape-determining protein MreC [Frisingicoccus caecimuris]|uniref:Cell shape-determining protein MreC n=1 Tax=Frisingicoccus caecimuris TaxID=1796636 RepID=A0A4R2LIR3_9FIRM|nr:rod shape-determining protein MreC [Frisingicoccus caecimuris]MCR1918653.1 rod shape-determining protein MreC [Frisingicoccus caecimuris]TCO86285.1 rod shape-determining protein MreC [Frisingicoccus caecimuris]